MIFIGGQQLLQYVYVQVIRLLIQGGMELFEEIYKLLNMGCCLDDTAILEY